ncbi:reverse transcriptase domain-containing protein [Rhodobacteraceae bacterium KMM 6894]|nr:reverse transcriptase domain-containing protein [Rhodobacteraceae bacterium KMM 6894]
MPPRSYYIEPRATDYLAYANAFFPEDLMHAKPFVEQNGLPYISDLSHLSAYLGVSPKLLRQIMHNPSYHYDTFPLKKPNRKPREITAPKTYLKVIQWWICDNILHAAPLHDCVHGFRRGRSFISNAKCHIGQKHILNVDIKRFFPSIDSEKVKECFVSLGYPQEGATVLTGLVTLDGVTPTGAPTSPMIGNIALRGFDIALSEYAAQKNLNYTRYADDLTISSNSWIEKETLDDVGQLVKKYGFALNAGKTKFMSTGDRMEVTGIVINSKPNLLRSWRNSKRGYLNRVIKSPHLYIAERSKVLGILGVLLAVDPKGEMAITKQAKRAADSLEFHGLL